MCVLCCIDIVSTHSLICGWRWQTLLPTTANNNLLFLIHSHTHTPRRHNFNFSAKCKNFWMAEKPNRNKQRKNIYTTHDTCLAVFILQLHVRCNSKCYVHFQCDFSQQLKQYDVVKRMREYMNGWCNPLITPHRLRTVGLDSPETRLMYALRSNTTLWIKPFCLSHSAEQKAVSKCTSPSIYSYCWPTTIFIRKMRQMRMAENMWSVRRREWRPPVFAVGNDDEENVTACQPARWPK